jgi:hypothetical protein
MGTLVVADREGIRERAGTPGTCMIVSPSRSAGGSCNEKRFAQLSLLFRRLHDLPAGKSQSQKGSEGARYEGVAPLDENCFYLCVRAFVNRFDGQGAAPTLQENDKKTVADFLGSQQKLGRRFKKDASTGMSNGAVARHPL